MSENAYVVVFPSIFTQNKMSFLVANIKKILKLRKQAFGKIKQDGSVIVLEANDPVFASSAINLLFGIDQVAIAKQVKNEFDTVVSEISKIGANLLLKGETFYVQVDGYSSGYLPKDVEMASTSSIIEKTINLGAKPGTEEKHDKQLYTYLTKSNAYVCIFTDKGHGGIPNDSLKRKTLCCVYDELSAVSCLETIKEGYCLKIIVCYKKQSDLLNLAKILNQILPRTLQSKVELEFFQLMMPASGVAGRASSLSSSSSQGFLLMVESITKILTSIAKLNKITLVSLALSPLIFPSHFIENSLKQVFQSNLIPLLPLGGLDNKIFDTAKEIGLGKHLPQINRLAKMKFDNKSSNNIKNSSSNHISGTTPIKKMALEIAKTSLKTKKIIKVTVGPTNVHDILDSLQVNH